MSSAGIERELTRDWHFKKYIGEQVVLRLIRPFEGEREFKGELLGRNDGAVAIKTNSGELSFLQNDIAFVRLYADF